MKQQLLTLYCGGGGDCSCAEMVLVRRAGCAACIVADEARVRSIEADGAPPPTETSNASHSTPPHTSNAATTVVA